MLKNILWALLVGVLFSLTGTCLWWLFEPSISFKHPVVKVITQSKGEMAAIGISPDAYAKAGKFTLYVSIINSRGRLVHYVKAAPVVVGKKYMVVTRPDLQVGLFDVVATVEYRLNPLRSVSEDIQIAVLKVE